MQKESSQLTESLGKLIQHVRAQSMDQSELATRVGVSRTTISAIENGKPVNAQALFNVLEHLELLTPYLTVVDEQLSELSTHLIRKQRKPVRKLTNDF